MENLQRAISLGAMLYCEERGDYRVMRAHLKRWGAKIVEEGDLSDLQEFSRLLMRVIDAIDEENRLGAGSLIDQTHPDHIEWKNIRCFPSFGRISQQ